MINFPILKNKFLEHRVLKKQLLDQIEKQESNSLKQEDDYFSDSIHKLDWDRKNDQTRQWIKIIFKDLKKHFESAVEEIGLQGVGISALWFQQYENNDRHGWHVHGDNFTGVYYLEYEKDLPKTQIIEPLTKKIIEVDVQEGDIIIFPSVFIHRAPKNLTNKRKTIISFNFATSYIDKKYLRKLVDMYGN